MTEKVFLHQLRRGIGSAIIELKENPERDKYRDIVLRCCLRDISHDWQVEGRKGRYLYLAICALGDKGYLEKILIGEFLSRCPDRLFGQLSEILSCYADDGSESSKDAFRAKYKYFASKNGRLSKTFSLDEGYQLGNVALRLFTIDGFFAFKRYATDMGELLKGPHSNRNVLYYDCLITEAEDIFGKKRTNAFTMKMYEKSDAIKSLIDAITSDEFSRRQYQESRKEEQVAVETIVQTAKEMASGEIRHYGPIMRLRRPFLKNASEADVLELAHVALREENETVKGLLLRIFLSSAYWKKPFPLGIAPLLEYARSDNQILYETVLGLLEEFKDKRIRELAMQLLKAKGIKSFALGLLQKNYRKSVDPIIAGAIKRASSIPQHVQSDIVEIYSRHRSAGALPILLHAYQKGECSHCRFGIVKALHHNKVLPDEILAQCLYDSYEDTRKLAKRLLEKRSERKCF